MVVTTQDEAFVDWPGVVDRLLSPKDVSGDKAIGALMAPPPSATFAMARFDDRPAA